LTAEQQHLVHDNLGLIAVHLRRRVPDLSQPRREREWDDLFQEGCLGLMDAARKFQAGRGVPFAAYAMLRIHAAVSRALRNRFSLVHIPPPYAPRAGGSKSAKPPRERRERRAQPDGSRRATPREAQVDGEDRPRPTTHTWSGRYPQSPPDGATHDSEADGSDLRERAGRHALGSRKRHRGVVVTQIDEALEAGLTDRHRPGQGTGVGDTIGARLRAKLERAVLAAGDRLGGCRSARGDRSEVVQAVARERVLVPHEEVRTPLREIARRTRSSYGRVVQCERQLVAAAKARLDGDPEFAKLRERARREAAGVRVPVDAELERELVEAGLSEFLRRYTAANARQRGGLLQGLVEAARADVPELARACFVRLSPEERERMLTGSGSCVAPSGVPADERGGKGVSRCRRPDHSAGGSAGVAGAPSEGKCR